MLESLTAETFRPHEGSEFEVRGPADAAAEPIVLRLTEVRSLGHQPHAPRVDPFALEFSGPSAPMLEQRTYGLTHPALGEIEIFLVPVGFDPAGGLLYEAVFN